MFQPKGFVVKTSDNQSPSALMALPADASKNSQETSIDRISNLPEPILCHILSFLETVEAVSTCVLSTKWKRVWTGLSTLRFNNISKPFYCYVDSSKKQKFAAFVERVLLLHNVQSLEEFSLHCVLNSDPYDVTKWVDTAILKGVRRLDLMVTSGPPVRLPSSLFTCKMLEVLKLAYYILVDVPSVICLPNLRNLTLEYMEYMEFKDDESVSKLISSCSSLESLVAVLSSRDEVAEFNISSSSLRELKIDLYVVELCTVVSAINAPALQCLDLCLEGSTVFKIESLPSLVQAKIDDTDFGIRNLYQLLCNVKILSIWLHEFTAPIPARKLPKYHNLTQLEVEADCCQWGLLLEFLKNSNKLEDIKLKKYHKEKDHIHEICWRNPSSVPECFLSSLRTMSIVRFGGLEDELAMVKYILENATVMRSVKIQIDSSVNNETKIELLQKLSQIRRGSAECEISLS